MGWIRRLVGLVVVALLALALSGCDRPSPWRSELVSAAAAADDAGNGQSGAPQFNADGTKVLFLSDASDLGPTDTNGQMDLYLRDVATGATTLVTANAAGTDSANGETLEPGVFSPDGTKVLFQSGAGDLGPTDDNGFVDVYLRDLTTGTTTLVSVDAAGTGAANRDSYLGGFNADGTKVVFTSHATDLGPGDINEGSDVYVRDLTTGTTVLASPNAVGTDGAGGTSDPIFSPDGTKIAFRSFGNAHGAIDTNGQDDVYVHDLTTGATELVSANAAGNDSGNGFSFQPVFSPDSTKVAFTSWATDLGPADTNSIYDVYMRDLGSATTSLVSVNAAGTRASTGGNPTFSPDGRRILFESSGADLVPVDTNGADDVFLRDLTTGTTSLVSVRADGADAGNGDSWLATFSGDGTKVAFTSQARNLGSADGSAQADVYLRDLTLGRTLLVSANADGLRPADGTRSSSWASANGDGSQVAFVSNHSDFGPADANGVDDVYLATLRRAATAIRMSARPEPVATGGEITYEIDVDAAGPDPAVDVEAVLAVADGLTVTGVSTDDGTCTFASRVLECRLGEMPTGATAAVTVTARVAAPAGSTLDATVKLSSPTFDPDETDNRAMVTTTVGAG